MALKLQPRLPRRNERSFPNLFSTYFQCRLGAPGTLAIVTDPDFQANLRVAQVPVVLKLDRRGGTVFAHCQKLQNTSMFHFSFQKVKLNCLDMQNAVFVFYVMLS